MSAAVPEAGLMPDEHLAGAEAVPVGASGWGGWVIHRPAVVCTSSPSTTTSVKLGPTVSGATLAS